MFAELFNEMLQRDFGVRIYKSLLSLPEKEDKKEKDKKSKKEDRKEKREERDDETDEPKAKQRRSDDKEKKEDRDERKVCCDFHDLTPWCRIELQFSMIIVIIRIS